MDLKLDASERALLDAFRQDAGPSDAAIERIRLRVEGEVAARPRQRRRWMAMVALTVVAAGALWWLRPAQHSEVRVAERIEAAGGTDTGEQCVGEECAGEECAGDGGKEPPSNDKREVGVVENGRVSPASKPRPKQQRRSSDGRPSDWRERIRSRARQKPAASKQPPSRVVPAPHGPPSAVMPPASGSAGGSAAPANGSASPRPSSTPTPTPDAGKTPVGVLPAPSAEEPSAGAGLQSSSSPEPNGNNDTNLSHNDNNSAKPDNADAGYEPPPATDSPPANSTPEGYCGDERDSCLDAGGDASCFDAWASCLIEFACESFHDQQCLPEFSEADCALERQRCYLIPDDYFLEVCRFRLNQCSEDNPETADLCEAELQPCFDAAAELFGAPPQR